MSSLDYFTKNGYTIEETQDKCKEFDPKAAVRSLMAAEVIHKIGQIPRRVLGMNDLSAAEIRMMVQCCMNETLIDNFTKADKFLEKYRIDPSLENKEQYKLYSDVHLLTASIMYSVAIELAKTYRKISKTISLGLIYGRGVASIAKQIGDEIDSTQKKIDQFYEALPGLKEQIEGLRTIPSKLGYIQNEVGRRRNLEAMQSQVDYLVAKQARQSANSRVQGVSTDINNLAAGLFCHLFERLDKKAELEAHCLVHDATYTSFNFEYDHFYNWIGTNLHAYNKGIREKCEKWFGFHFPTPLNIDLDVSLCGVPKSDHTKVFGWGSPIAVELGGYEAKGKSKVKGGLAKLTWVKLLHQYYVITDEIHEDTKHFIKESHKDIRYWKRKDLEKDLFDLQKKFGMSVV